MFPMFLDLDSGIPRIEDLQQQVDIPNVTSNTPSTEFDHKKMEKWLAKFKEALLNGEEVLSDQILSLIIKLSVQDGSNSALQSIVDLLLEHAQLKPAFVEASIRFAANCSEDGLFEITQIFIALDSHFENLRVLILRITIRLNFHS